MTKYEEVRDEFFKLQGEGKLKSERFDTEEIVWAGKTLSEVSPAFTGVEVFYRLDGSRICEEESFDGAAQGCARYYDAKGKLVGQDYCRHGVFCHHVFGKPHRGRESLCAPRAMDELSVLARDLERAGYEQRYEPVLGVQGMRRFSRGPRDVLVCSGGWSSQADFETFLDILKRLIDSKTLLPTDIVFRAGGTLRIPAWFRDYCASKGITVHVIETDGHLPSSISTKDSPKTDTSRPNEGEHAPERLC